MSANAESESPVDLTMEETRGISAHMEKILLLWSRNGRQLARPLKITLICFFIALFLSLATFNTVNELRHLDRALERKTAITQRLLNFQKTQTIAGLEKTLQVLKDMSILETVVQSRNPDQLRAILDKMIPIIPGNQQISELNLFDADRQLIETQGSLPNSEKPPVWVLLEQAARTGEIASGLVPGKDGSPTFAAVAPVSDSRGVIGYIRLGVEMRHSLMFVHTALSVGIIEYQPAAQMLSRPGVPTTSLRLWQKTENAAYRPVGKTLLPADITMFLGGRNSNDGLLDRMIWTQDRLLVVDQVDLPYADKSKHSTLLITHDITEDALTLLKSLAFATLLFCLLAVITWVLFNRLSSGLQRAVYRTRAKLEKAVQENTKALEHQKDRLEEAQRVAAVGSWERNLRTGEVTWSEQIYTIAGIPHSVNSTDAVETYYSMVPADELQKIQKLVEEHTKTCTPFEIVHQLVRENGDVRHLHVRCNIEAGEDGLPLRMFGTTRDITEQHNALDRSQWLAGILEASLNEIYVIDPETFVCVHANQCARENLGYAEEELLGLSLWEITQETNRAFVIGVIQKVVDGSVTSLKLEAIHKRKDGSLYPVEVRLQGHKSRGKVSLVAICNDISERMQRENEALLAREEAERLAYFDPLTELPNRAACQRDAKIVFAPENPDKPAFIIHIDIDNFKRINDTLGHSAGDACLEETGERLQTGCFGLGTAYRWGGDEFVILASGPDADPEELCERLNLVMRGPMEYEGNQIWPSVSMGVARCPDDGEDFSSLLVHADLALYRSKDEGKDRWSYFTSDMKIDSDEEARLEQELRHALRRDEFFLVFQPQVDNRTQQVTGVEALVRWQHPTRGVLAPGAFLDVMEKTSLAVPLGQIVLDKAIAAAGKWKKAGLHFGRMAVNLSPSHLPSGTLLQDFLNAMTKYDVGPELLTAEVLESVFLDTERNHNWHVLEELYDRGIHIELDDFGTGYASLSHVADLPINGLKIDRSFTAQILTDNKKEIVVNHLIHLARALNINVVCEGVETETQFERLRMMGNFSVQGYLIARPMTFDQMTTWLDASPNDLTYFI